MSTRPLHADITVRLDPQVPLKLFIELRSNVQLDTKRVISGMPFPTNLLAGIEKTGETTTRNTQKIRLKI